MRIATIFVRHGTRDYPGAEEELAQVFRRRLPDVKRYTVVVDNALNSDPTEVSPERALIRGDNRMREFSAFDRGVAHLGSRIWDFDFIHLATSAFNTLYTAYLERLDPDLLRALCGQAACLGHIDCYNEPIDVYTYQSQHWMRSCFVMLPPAEVKALKTLVSVKEPALLFSGDPTNPFRDDAPISVNYRRYIQDWLEGQDIGQGVRWHSAFKLTAEALPAFEEKTVSILNEHLLAIRLRAQGCRLIDATWLAGASPQTAGQRIPWQTAWNRQISQRPADPPVNP